jgi:hypothetical protein
MSTELLEMNSVPSLCDVCNISYSYRIMHSSDCEVASSGISCQAALVISVSSWAHQHPLEHVVVAHK